MFGVAHPTTLRSYNNLAMLLKEQGRYEEADNLLERIIASSEAVVEKKDLAATFSLNNLKMLLKESKVEPLIESLSPLSPLGSGFLFGDFGHIGCCYCAKPRARPEKDAVERHGPLLHCSDIEDVDNNLTKLLGAAGGISKPNMLL